MTITMKIDPTNNQKFPMSSEKQALHQCTLRERKSSSTTPLNLKRRNSITSEEGTIILSLTVMVMEE